MIKYFTLFALAICSVFCFNNSSKAQTWQESMKFTSNPREISSRYGNDVAISGNFAVVGHAEASVNGKSKAGKALVYEKKNDSWVFMAELNSEAPTSYEYFGYSVAIDGNTIVVGCTGYDGGVYREGAAFVFEMDNNNWTQTAKLVGSNPQDSDRLGESLAILGTRILVGSPNADSPAGSGTGIVLVYDYDGMDWTETDEIYPAAAPNNFRSAKSISLAGNRVFISGPLLTNTHLNQGGVFVFEYDGMNWLETDTIYSPNPEADAAFGEPLYAKDANTLLIGAPQEDFTGVYNSGRAYLVDRNGGDWDLFTTFDPTNPEASGNFGSSLSMDVDLIAIGHPEADPNAVSGGGTVSVIEYDGMSWIETAILSASDQTMNEGGNQQMGASLAISGNTIIAGAPKDHLPGQWSSNAGAVYFFDNVCHVTSSSETICQGQTFAFGGLNLNQTGVYQAKYMDMASCDSIHTLTLTVSPAPITNIAETICQGDDYVLGTQTLTSTGIYQEDFADINGCDSIVEIDLTVEDCASISENEKNSFQVYPNPVLQGNELIIRGNFNQQQNTLTIYDMLGAEVFTASLTGNSRKISTTNFKKGLYILEISGKKGQKSQKKLFIH